MRENDDTTRIFAYFAPARLDYCALHDVGGAVAFGISSLQEASLSCHGRGQHGARGADWGLGNTAKDLMRNFAQNLRTVEVSQRVIDRAQLDMNPYDLLANLEVVEDASTFTIKIHAENPDGEVARLSH